MADIFDDVAPTTTPAPTRSPAAPLNAGASRDIFDDVAPSPQPNRPIVPIADLSDEVGAPSGQQGAVIGTPTPLQRSMPNKSFQGFVSNMGTDLGTIGQGLGVLGSAVVSRTADAITPRRLIDNPQQAISDLGKQITNPDWQGALKALPGQIMGGATGAFVGNDAMGTKPMFRVLGNQNEPSDIPVAVDMAGNILQDYAKNYIDPALRGDFNAIGERAYQHPVLTGLDVAPTLGPAKFVGNSGAKLAGRVATSVLPADLVRAGEVAGIVGKGAAVEAGQAVVNSAVAAVKKLPFVVSAMEKAQQWKQITNILAKHDKEFRKELKEQYEWVKDAYTKIPKNAFTDEELTNIVTLRDVQKYGEAMSGPHADAVTRFMDRLSSVNKWVAGRLAEVGGMTDDEARLATFGPYALKKLQEATGNADLPHSVLTLDDIAAAEAELADLGVEPAYLGIIPQPVSKAVRSNAGQMFGGIGRTAKKLANEQVVRESVGADPPTTGRPGFLTPREKGHFDPKAHEANPLNAFEVRLTESLGFLQIREALTDVIQNPALVGEGVNFPLKAHLDDLAQGSGLAAPEWAKLFNAAPEVVKLPKRVAAELDRVMGSQPNLAQKLFFEWPNKVFKTGTLAIDMGWAVQQTLQNGLISGWSMFKGPDDAARSLMAYALAFDKRAAKVATEWIYDTHGEKVVTQVPKGLAQVGAVAKAYMDTVFGVATAGDNYFRVVKGLHSLMAQIEKAEPNSRLPMAKAFDSMARFDQIEKAATNPQYAAAAVKDIRNWFFDYGPQMAEQWRLARSLDPFFLWHMHSVNLVKTAAIETPVKNAVLSELAQYAPEKLQKGVDEQHKKMGMVPTFDAEGNPRVGPNGGQLLMGRSGFLPLTQPFDLVQQGYAMLTGSTPQEHREGLPPITPVLAWVIGMAGKNPQNMSPWRDPRLNSVSGQQFAIGPDGEAIPMDVKPDAGELAFRSMLPRQDAFVRDTIAGDMVPSDFTNPLEVAPKRDSNDEPLKNFTPIQKAFYTLTKTKPTEVTRSADDADAMKEKQQKKFEFVRDHYQTERGKPVLTAIGKLLKKEKD